MQIKNKINCFRGTFFHMRAIRYVTLFLLKIFLKRYKNVQRLNLKMCLDTVNFLVVKVVNTNYINNLLKAVYHLFFSPNLDKLTTSNVVYYTKMNPNPHF
jgi:hypothetical protein